MTCVPAVECSRSVIAQALAIILDFISQHSPMSLRYIPLTILLIPLEYAQSMLRDCIFEPSQRPLGLR